jgi:hypothetical protein
MMMMMMTTGPAVVVAAVAVAASVRNTRESADSQQATSQPASQSVSQRSVVSCLSVSLPASWQLTIVSQSDGGMSACVAQSLQCSCLRLAVCLSAYLCASAYALCVYSHSSSFCNHYKSAMQMQTNHPFIHPNIHTFKHSNIQIK